MATLDTQKIADFLATHRLGSGLGTAEEPCSIAAINLALSGRLTDDVPECMSPVIGQWIIGVQDAMPDDLRNSRDWKALLPLAAGTGRDPALEQRRAALLLDWMWTDVLPLLQSLADEQGFGRQWRTMLTETTAPAVRAMEAWLTEVAVAPEAPAWALAAEVAVATASWAAEAEAADAAAALVAQVVSKAAQAAQSDFWPRAGAAAILRRLIETDIGEGI